MGMASVAPQRSHPDQRAAVVHDGAAARIIAPAGSGKTRVLTERARHLLGTWRVPSGALSLVAFNKRAQLEIQERTGDLRGLRVRTLNAIALAIVNGTAPFRPQPRTFRTIDEIEVRRIIGRLVQFPRKRNTDPVAAWIEALSVVRLGLRTPDQVETMYGGDVDGLADMWPRYRATLEREGALDFDEQVYRAIEVLLADPDAREAAQRACRLLLVDEFQDLTPGARAARASAAAPGFDVFGVGDDDQTIYGYSGAEPGVADRLRRAVPRRRRTTRSRSTTAAPAMSSRHADRLRPSQPAAGRQDHPQHPPRHRPGCAWSHRAETLHATLDAVTAAAGSGPLAARHRRAHPRQRAARARSGWARRRRNPGAGWGRHRVPRTHRRCAPRLRGCASPWVDRIRSLLAISPRRCAGRRGRCIRTSPTGWPNRARSPACAASPVGSTPSAMRPGSRRSPTTSVVSSAWPRSSTAAQLLGALADDIGLGAAIATLDDGRHGMNRAAQNDDLVALTQLAALHPDPATFGGWLRQQLSVGRSEGGVVLATVHRVKGQEWPVVVVHHAEADQYPHRLAEDLEEERRVFHVAITRGSEQVIVVVGGDPSPFVDDMANEPQRGACPVSRPGDRIPSPRCRLRPSPSRRHATPSSTRQRCSPRQGSSSSTVARSGRSRPSRTPPP